MTVPPSPLRVLFFLSDLDGGGAQRTVVNLLNRLPPERIEALLAAGRTDGPARAWLDPGRHLMVLGARRIRLALWPLRRAVRRLRPGVLFSTMVDANILAAAATRGMRDPPPLVLRETNSQRARDDLGRLRRRAAAWAFARADRVVALSEGVRRELIADCTLPPSQVVTIPNPVEVEDWRARAAAARRAAPPWGAFATPGKVLIGAGRLARQKGFDLMLRAVAALRDPAVRVMILGDGPDRAALESLAASLGLADRVLMPGFVADPGPWFAHADLFVLASRWEGFGHVIVEAMACGLPVLAADCPYGPAEIIADGVTGRLVPPEDEAALARALSELLANAEARKRLAEAGMRRAGDYAPDRIAARYADLFESVAARRGRA